MKFTHAGVSSPAGRILGLPVQKRPGALHSSHKGRGHCACLQFPAPPMVNGSDSPTCPRCHSTHSRRHLPCVCSSQPPPFSTLPPSSMPVDTDEHPSLRRASFDSDCSMFSHFSITPESEASLRAWEQKMLGPTTPTPTPSKATQGTGKATSRRWVVFFGRNPGIYNTL